MKEQLRTKELISEEFSVGDLLRVPCIIIIMMAHAGSMYTHLQVVVPAVPSAFLQTLRLNITMMRFYCVDNSRRLFVLSAKICTKLYMGALHLMVNGFSNVMQ